MLIDMAEKAVAFVFGDDLLLPALVLYVEGLYDAPRIYRPSAKDRQGGSWSPHSYPKANPNLPFRM